MAKERSLKTGILIIICLVLLTLILAPFGIFTRIHIYTLSFISSIMEKAGLYRTYSTRSDELDKARIRLTAMLKQKEAEIYDLKKQIRESEMLESFPSAKESSLISAHVVFYDPSSAKCRLVLNRGVRHGVRNGAVVLSGSFLLGRIISVSASSSTVLLINDPRASFSVYVGKERVTGIIKGRGKGNRLSVEYIDNQPENTVKQEDIVETSGFSEGVPPHILIGTVYNNPDDDTAQYNDFKRIYVKPYVNILTVKRVCILLYPSHLSEKENR